MIPQFIYSPCGSRARWDTENDMGYRCESCFAMIGSVGQPVQCQTEANKYKALEALGGNGWDYKQGKQQE